MSDIINDGGPAFPHDLEKHEGLLTTRFHGMSLRDWFAGMALQGLLGNYDAQKDICNSDPRYQRQPDGQFNFRDVVAINCYEFADAMLKERAK